MHSPSELIILMNHFMKRPDKLILLLILTFAGFIHAESSLGLSVGPNYTYASAEGRETYVDRLGLSGAFGVTTQLLFEKSLTQMFLINVGLGYEWKGFCQDNSQPAFGGTLVLERINRFRYISMPLFLKARVEEPSPSSTNRHMSVYLLTGPQFNILLKGTTSDSVTIYDKIGTTTSYDCTKSAADLDIAWALGAGVEIGDLNPSLFSDIVYVRSISNLFKSEKSKMSLRSILLKVGIKLEI